ncbi:phosphatase 2C-like domain-containing protein [Tribonema minus]|uniref:protein-serine/threonine phosphatase n=1 Tax=Tribonema minus TaxID=303371 RepID=A0A836CHG2_9STRA|nr:phosphatase 2C-like domain-containing protein [Tribonema minus]
MGDDEPPHHHHSGSNAAAATTSVAAAAAAAALDVPSPSAHGGSGGGGSTVPSQSPAKRQRLKPVLTKAESCGTRNSDDDGEDSDWSRGETVYSAGRRGGGGGGGGNARSGGAEAGPEGGRAASSCGELDAVMDTLSAQPLRLQTRRPEAQPILEGIALLGRKLSCPAQLYSPGLGLRAASHSLQGVRPTQLYSPRLRLHAAYHSLQGIRPAQLSYRPRLYSPGLGLRAVRHSLQRVPPTSHLNPESMRVRCYVVLQEDKMLVVMDMARLVPPSQPPQQTHQQRSLLSQHALFAIFDGHNGQGCATRLMQQLPAALALHPAFPSSVAQALAAACADVDEDVCRRCLQEDDSSGSTGLLCCFDSRRRCLTVGNVGDSRCVACVGGRAVALSADQRLSRADERERVRRAGGVVANNRVNGVLAVTRSFGDVQHKARNFEFEVVGGGVANDRVNGVLAVTRSSGDVQHKVSNFKVEVVLQGVVVASNRANGVLAVTQSFEDVQYKAGYCEFKSFIGSAAGPSATGSSSSMSGGSAGAALIAIPEVTTQAVTSDTEFVLLASDGLWDVLDPQEAVNMARSALNEHGSLDRQAT